jgi:hypothetical protein
VRRSPGSQKTGYHRWQAAISIALGDLSSWKTLLRCEKEADAVLDWLRSPSRVYLTPFAADDRLAVPVAA